MKHILLIILFLLSNDLSAQDSTALRYNRNNHKVYQGSKKMSMDDLFRVMKPHPETFEIIESARDYKFFATVIYTLGAAPAGWALGGFLITNEMNWAVMGTGLGLIAVGVPLHIMYLKRTRQAVDSFNGRNDTGFEFRNRFNVSMNLNRNGLGVRLSF